MAVINDILDLSRIESGKMTVSHVACSPSELAYEVVRLMRPAALKKGLQLDVRVDSTVPARVISDPTRLRQIMMNLVANAVKFTDKGSVDLRLHYRAQQLPEPQLSLEVIDTGVGISAENLPLLFSPFQQVDDSASRRFGGTGLGLAISRRLAQMLGGDMSVRSDVGKGSCFSVWLAAPAAALGNAKPGTVAPNALVDLAGVRVLLAEDSPDSRKLVCIHLRRMGCQVLAVENGQQDVERAKESEATAEAFDVILMDMQMPVLDGYEAAWQLRSEGYDKPIIALTAHAMEGDRERCLDAGCTDYAVKPINIHHLSRMIRTHADRANKVER